MKNLKILIIAIIFIIIFFIGKIITSRMYFQHKVDGMRKWDNETSRWFSLTDLSPQEAQYKYTICLHRFGE